MLYKWPKKTVIAAASEEAIKAQLFQAVMEFFFFLIVTGSVQGRCWDPYDLNSCQCHSFTTTHTVVLPELLKCLLRPHGRLSQASGTTCENPTCNGFTPALLLEAKPFPKQRCDSCCCGFKEEKPFNRSITPEWLLSPQEKEIKPLSWDQKITHESFYRGTARKVCHLVLFGLAEPECS